MQNVGFVLSTCKLLLDVKMFVRCGNPERLGLFLYILSLSLFTLGVFGGLCSVIVISSWQFFYTICYVES